MNKFLLAIFVCLFSLGALACGGDHGDKDKEEDQRFETSM